MFISNEERDVASHDMKSAEPVLVAQTVTVVVGAVAAGVGYTLPDSTVRLIAGGAWLLISIVVTAVARGRVTPLAGGWQVQVEQIIEATLDDVASRIVNEAVASAATPEPAPAVAARFVPQWGPPSPQRRADTTSTLPQQRL